MATLLEVGAGMAGWLRACQDRDGRVLDPIHSEHGEYADGCAALAFGLMALETGDTAWREAVGRAVQSALRRPAESEFDSFALLLLAREARKDGRGAALCTLLPRPEAIRPYAGNRLVSHNWVAMRAVSHSLRAHFTADAVDQSAAERLWERVLAWQTPEGWFVDSPGGRAVPITYHAKFCAMLALAIEEEIHDTPDLRGALLRGLHVLAPFISPGGVLVPYGRSRHTLFGYAAALTALRSGARILTEPALERPAARLLDCVAHWVQADGHVPCVLRPGEQDRRDWDVYVNNPDYNGYAAALLLLEHRRAPQTSPFPAPPKSDLAPVPSAGPLTTFHSGGVYAALSLAGESVPLGAPFFCDHRYYGMQPLWIERNGESRFEPALYRWRAGADRRLLVDPVENHWIPYVLHNGAHYAVRHYERIETQHRQHELCWVAIGTPEAYDPVPRVQRVVHALLARVQEHPGPIFRVRPLRGVRLRRTLSWNTHTQRLSAHTEVVGTLPRNARLLQAEQQWPLGPA